VVASSLSHADAATLLGHLGGCGDRVVYEGMQKSKSLATRTDVFLRARDSKIGKPLTDAWVGSVHGQPAFSSDCTKIVLVSDEQ
jgi:hypothetical protein